MLRMHVHIHVEQLPDALAFYHALLGVEPVRTAEDRAVFSIDAPPLDITVSTGGDPGLERLGIGADDEEGMQIIQRRLGEANFAAAGGDMEHAHAPFKSLSAIDPMGLTWESYRVRQTPGADGRSIRVSERPGEEHAIPWDVPEDAAAAQRPVNVLFLCTGNSARSIIAEAIMNRMAPGKFRGFSAGSMPRGTINPNAVAILERMNHKLDGLRSKAWDEFAEPGAPKLDFVFTLCDTAAMEVCPIWPGQPMSAHWGLPDPAAVEGNGATVALAFADTYRMLNNRISIFVNLPLRELSKLSLQRRLDQIGRTRRQDS